MIIKLLKYSIKNILRNKFLSLSSILVLTLLMFFINLLLVLHHTSFELINYVNDKMSISLYLNEEYDKNSKDVIDLIDKLKTESPESEVNYKSQDEILNDIKKQDLELVKILEKKNPLPNTITVGKIPLSDYEKINYVIGGKLYLFSGNESGLEEDAFSNYSSQYGRITGVINKLKTLGLGIYVIISIFVFAIAIITYSIIGNFIYYYRDEIYITKLVGGSKAFIYGPFSLQGIIYSIISFFISLSAFYLFIKFGFTQISGISYSLDFVFENGHIIFPIQLLLFIFIGGLSGYFSSKKYLK